MAGMLIIQIAANVGMCLFVFPVMGLTPVSYTHLDVYKRQV